MDQKQILLLDATAESHARFYAQSHLFNSWLRSFDNIPDFLRFLTQILEPYSIEIYMARDNIYDNGLPSIDNGQNRTLIQTLSELQTIHHVSIFLPELNTEFERQFVRTLPDPRLIDEVISLVNLRVYMCGRGINYLEERKTRCQVREEFHLIDNLKMNIRNLQAYQTQLINDREQQLAPLEEAHSNKPSEEAS